MRIIQPTLLALAAALFLSACGGSSEVRVTEGSEQIGAAPTGTVFLTTDASVVHVDEITRIATFRNGNSFADGAFLIVKDRAGEQTGILKALPRRETGLRTADILEGEPDINNLVSNASASENARLAKIYRDPEEE